MARSDQQGGDESMAMASNEKLEEPDHSSSNWYFPREFIETDSPSRKDGIDLKKETNFRRSYCTFLQDLGMRLKVPQVTIATAIIFCHRFFLRQSHLKNDRYLIATTCMFLAGKVEETPKKLCDVILLSYEIRNKKDPTAVQKIKQKEAYVEQQKEQVLLGERMVLATLGFDFNIHHPYKPLVAAIKKFKVAKSALAQVAWNFVNDGLRTSLCLQFKPHHIAAGAIFLAAKFLKVKLPSEGEKVWWQEFDVTPRQLEEVSNQMLELYEQNRDAPTSRMSDLSTSIGTNSYKRPTGDAPSSSAVQQSEMVEDVKSIENMNGRKRSASQAFPVSVIEEDGNVEGDRKSRMNRNIKVDAMSIDPVIVLASDNGRNEQNTIDNNTSGKLANKATNNDVVGEMKSPTSCTSAIAAEISAGRVEESQSTGSTAIVSESNVVEEVGSNQNSSEETHLKTDWIGLADLNIDRVKAAIQRRKQGDETRACVRKRELTDEEELLEMDLENGHKDNQQEEMVEYVSDQGKDLERSDANLEKEIKHKSVEYLENDEDKAKNGHKNANLEKEIEHKSVEYLENDEDKAKNGHKRQIQPPLNEKFNVNVENETGKEPQTPPG